MTPEREKEIRETIAAMRARLVDLRPSDAAARLPLSMAEDLLAELDRLRRLPVIETCGQCRWVTDDPDSSSDPDSGTWCGRAPRRRRVDAASEPPEWCPLRGAR